MNRGMEGRGIGKGEQGGKGMLIFNEIADIVLISGTLWVVWELVAAAKIVASPPLDEAQNVVASVKALQVLVKRLSSQLGEVAAIQAPASSDEDGEREDSETGM